MVVRKGNCVLQLVVLPCLLVPIADVMDVMAIVDHEHSPVSWHRGDLHRGALGLLAVAVGALLHRVLPDRAGHCVADALVQCPADAAASKASV